MKEVTRYKTDDGLEWDSVEKAVLHDNLILAVKGITARLPELDISGTHFYQHVPADVLAVQVSIAKLAYLMLGGERDRHHYEAVIHADKPMGAYSLIGRFISDHGGPLDSAWGRIMRIDSKFREWEQPFYTLNTPPNAVEIKR